MTYDKLVSSKNRPPINFDLDVDIVDFSVHPYNYYSKDRPLVLDDIIMLSDVLYHYGGENLQRGIINIELLQVLDKCVDFIVNDIPEY